MERKQNVKHVFELKSDFLFVISSNVGSNYGTERLYGRVTFNQLVEAIAKCQRRDGLITWGIE